MAKIAALELSSRVTLTGEKTHAQLPDEYAAADVVVVPASSTPPAIATAFPTSFSKRWRAAARSLPAASARSTPRFTMANRRTGAAALPGGDRRCVRALSADRDMARARLPRTARSGAPVRPQSLRASIRPGARGGLCVGPGAIAYVLKSFPRLSETFIASEIYRLERQGVGMRLFVIKRSNEPFAHPVVDAIRAARAPAAGGVDFGDLGGALAGRALARVCRAARTPAAPASGRDAARRRDRIRACGSRPQGDVGAAAQVAAQGIPAGDGARRRDRRRRRRAAHSRPLLPQRDDGRMAGVDCDRLPLSFTAHAKDVYCADFNPAGLLARKLAAARFVVTCTEANRAYLQALTATPVHCIYHGLDVEFARLCGGGAAASTRIARAGACGRPPRRQEGNRRADRSVRDPARPRRADRGDDRRRKRRPGDGAARLVSSVVGRRGIHWAVDAARLFDRAARDRLLFAVPGRRERRPRRHSQRDGRSDGVWSSSRDDRCLGHPRVARPRGQRPARRAQRSSGGRGRDRDAASQCSARRTAVANAQLQIRERFDGDVSTRALSALLTAGAA